MIDLPQAVDPKKNRHAESLLARDVARLCEHFARRGDRPGIRLQPRPICGRRGRSQTSCRRSFARSSRRRLSPALTWADTATCPSAGSRPCSCSTWSGSTHIAAQLGDAHYRELSSRFNRLVRAALKRFGGKEEDHAGDGFFATFPQPDRAIRCAGALAEEVRNTRHRDPLRHPHRPDGGSGRQDPRHRGRDRGPGDVAGAMPVTSWSRAPRRSSRPVPVSDSRTSRRTS